LTSPANITGFSFWSAANPGGTFSPNPTWQIYENSVTTPGALLTTGTAPYIRVANGTAAGQPQFRSDVTIPSTALSAGTYWLGLHNGPLTNTGFSNVFWTTTNSNGTPLGQERLLAPVQGGWSSSALEHAFFIVGSATSTAAPDPSTVAFFPLGGLIMASALMTRRRRRRRIGNSKA
jgi:hypothetical protein